MPDPLLHNPRVLALATAAAPLREDRLALQRLVARYGEDVPLGQALDAARAVIDELGARYRAMKARGEAL